MSVTFVGIALELESVTQLGLSTLRVRFTQTPLQASPAGTHDALNPFNWSLTGPGAGSVKSCAIVSDDPQSIDLILVGPLAIGTWSINGSTNIQTATSAPLTNPTSLQFTVTNTGNIEPVNPGSVNDTDEDIIRKHLNEALAGDGWNALIAALATGEKKNRENAQAAFDQLFTSTASGLYLERKASDAGIERPINMGMSDDTFRQYTIRITNNKLTEESLLEILEVFYGDSSLRASNTSGVTEPYFLDDGDDLNFLVDEEITVPVVFSTDDFAIISQAKAVEVAAAITRACRIAGSQAYAAPIIDPQTGISVVTIFSSALGLGSSVRVLGGRAQNILKFADLLPIYTGVGSPTWNITVDSSRGIMRFTTASNTVDLSQLIEGDYVNIFGSEFNAGNKGSFTVTTVSVTYPSGILSQYFEVINTKAVQQTGLVQTAQSDVMYFRPTKKTIHATADRAVIVSVPGEEVDVILPATSQAVSRAAYTGAYVQSQTPINVTSLERINGTVTAIATAHGFSIGDWIEIDGAVANLTFPTITAGNHSTTTDYSQVSVASEILPAAGTQNRKFPTVAVFSDGTVYVSGGLNGTSVNQAAEALGYVSASTLTTGVQYTLSQPAQSNTAARFAFSGTVLSTYPTIFGRIVLFGGTDLTTENNLTKLVSNGSSIAGPNLSFAVGAPMAVELLDKTIIAFGGVISTVGTAQMQIYNPSANTWSNPATNMTEPRVQGAFVHVISPAEKVYVFGGRSLATGNLNYAGTGDMGPISCTVGVYTPGVGWANTNIKMEYTRFGHKAFLLDDGNYLVIGGWGYSASGTSTTPARLATTEIVDANGSRPGPSMRIGRAFFAADRIGNKIYVAGGTPSSTIIEILDLKTMQWSISTANLNVAVDKTDGVKLTNNLFVVACGEVSGSSDSEYRVISIASDTFMGSGLNGQFKVTAVPNSNTFQYSTPNQTAYTKTSAATATNMAAAAGLFPGPFSFDVDSGIAVTGTETTLTQELDATLQYSSVNVADATKFPDEDGWLVFDFGYTDAVYPVRYFGRLSTTSLSLDYSFKFPKTIFSGAKVCLLQQKGPWTPTNPAAVGSFYLTDSSSGRIGAEQAINNSVAAGITVNTIITYPGDRGLGNEGYPVTGNYKISDRVEIWGSDDVDADEAAARSK